MAGNIYIYSDSISTQTGSKIIGPLTIKSANPVGQITDSAFPAAQSNTILVPAGTVAIIIVPPVTNLVVLTLKGIAGDTGIPIYPNSVTVLTVAPGLASFVLTSASAITGNVEITFM